jgi:hypothetical protein
MTLIGDELRNMDFGKIVLIDTGAVGNNDNDIRSQFERAVVTVMNSAGYTFDLPFVAWRVATGSEGIFVAGTLEGSDAISGGLRWAGALAMKEYETTRIDGGREWVTHHGPWRVELLGLPRDRVFPMHGDN